MENTKVILKSGKDMSVRRFHPWVFSGAIKKIKGEVEEGDLVDVYDNKDEYLGTGHYQDGSIAVRLITFTEEKIDQEFWNTRIQAAFQYRKSLGFINNNTTNTYRLVFAEGDMLPGLIIDHYNGTLVLQAHSIGMHKSLDYIAEALKSVYKEDLSAIYDKSVDTLPKQYASNITAGYIYGAPKNKYSIENNCKFIVDWQEGQKTGFFIDQRDSRALLAKYASGKKVLNTFCYSGGFSIYASKAGAALVHSVDSSKRAIELTNKNYELNEISIGHEAFASDTFDFFKNSTEQYDIIILDPPAFAKHQKVKHNAVMGYKRLNAEAISRIQKGGILFTFSCSQVIDNKLFYNTVMSAAIQAGRKARVMHKLGQPSDHPVNIFHPEGEYLKGLVLYID